MKFVDLFCGMGTIRMGFEQAGHECVYSVEWDKHKRKIYEVIFGHEPEGKDITTVRADDIPRADCWCFGAPCQDFSIAGIRAGLDGDRSSLVREVFRLVRETQEEHRPEWLFYENVKGMLSSNKGLDYLEILFEMASLGYDIQYQLLNSKDFRVPQNRERVYTLGHLRNRGERKVFPVGEASRAYNATESDESSIQVAGRINSSQDGFVLSPDGISKTITSGHFNTPKILQLGRENNHGGERDIAPTLTGSRYEQNNFVKQIANVMPTATRDNPNQGSVYDPDGLAPCLNKMEGGGREPMVIDHGGVKKTKLANCLDANYYKGFDNHGQRTGILFTQKRITQETGISNTLGSKHGGGLQPHIVSEPIACLTPDRPEKRQKGRRFKEPGDPMFTLTKQDVHGVAYQHRIRRLTPRECMRLQGVPDYITDKLIAAGISDTQLYRAAGDACTVNVIHQIALAISPEKNTAPDAPTPEAEAKN